MRDTTFDPTVIVDPETGEPYPAAPVERAWGRALNVLLRCADRVFYVIAPPIDHMTWDEQTRNEAHFLACVAGLIVFLTLLFVGFQIYIGSRL